MENKPTPKRFPFAVAMWNGIKKPLICALVMIIAAVLLIALQARKTAYDKKQNATYQLVGQKSLTAGDDVIVIPGQEFVEAVKNRFTPADRLLPGGVDPARIVRRSVEAAVPQNFKTPIELSAKLTEGINKQKDDWLKVSQDKFDKALADNDANERNVTRALNQLKSETGDDKLDVASIVRNSKSESLTTALKDDKELSTKKDVSRVAAENSVKKFYEAKKTSLTDLTTDISATEESFHQIIAEVNAELDHQIAQRKDAPSARAGGLLSAPSGPINPTLALMLDEKQGLVGLYWLARVALTGTILFAFLFLILIPLKHLFFWTASGDVLTEYTKKLLEAKTSAVGPTVARAAMVTVAAATVAGGAALVANGLPFAGPSEKLTPSTIADELDKRKVKGDPGPGDKTNAPTTIALEKQIAELVTKIGDLEFTVRNMPAPTNTITNNTDQELAKSVQQLITNGFGQPGANEPSTLFSSLSGLRSNQGSFETAVNGRLNTIDQLIGTKSDGPTTNPSTLFAKVNSVFDTIGTRSISNLTGGASDPTVIESLRGLGTSASTDDNTLFGRTRSMQQSVNRVSDTAVSIRRDQLGTGGRNFFTQSKTLFSSERFRISRAAFDEIARDWGENDLLRNKLESLVNEYKTYSEDELRVAMGPLLPGVWDTVKRKIIRYARVERF